MSEWAPGYMVNPLQALRRLGLRAKALPIKGVDSSEKNAQVIKDYVLASDKPAMLWGHSKGGIDILEALRLYPEIRAKVAGVVLVQSPYKGTPIADFVLKHKPLRWLGTALMRSLGSEPRVIYELTEHYRQMQIGLGRYDRIFAEIPIYTVATATGKEDPNLAARALLTLNRLMGIDHPTDGLVPLENQRAEGAKNHLTLNGLSHADTFGPDAYLGLIAKRQAKSQETTRKTLQFILNTKPPRDGQDGFVGVGILAGLAATTALLAPLMSGDSHLIQGIKWLSPEFSAFAAIPLLAGAVWTYLKSNPVNMPTTTQTFHGNDYNGTYSIAVSSLDKAKDPGFIHGKTTVPPLSQTTETGYRFLSANAFAAQEAIVAAGGARVLWRRWKHGVTTIDLANDERHIINFIGMDVSAVAVDVGGTMIAVAMTSDTNEHLLALWEPAANAYTLWKLPAKATHLAFSLTNYSLMAMALEGDLIATVNIAATLRMKSFRSPVMPVAGLAFMLDGSLAAIGRGGTLSILEISGQTATARIISRPSMPHTIIERLVAGDDGTVTAITSVGSARVYNAQKTNQGVVMRLWNGHRIIDSATLAGKRAYAMQESSLFVEDMPGRWNAHALPFAYKHVALNADGKTMAFISAGATAVSNTIHILTHIRAPQAAAKPATAPTEAPKTSVETAPATDTAIEKLFAMRRRVAQKHGLAIVPSVLVKQMRIWLGEELFKYKAVKVLTDLVIEGDYEAMGKDSDGERGFTAIGILAALTMLPALAAPSLFFLPALLALPVLGILLARKKSTKLPARTARAKEPIIEHELTNGFKIILRRDTSRPLIAYNVTINGASRSEIPAQAGYAHLVEHVITRGPSQKQQELESHDSVKRLGKWDAETQFDFTRYAFTLAKENFDESLWRAADALLTLRLTPQALEKDKNG
ncbi:MAG: insulinase family protein, partial [Elusimicrobiota bacterium]